jgi:hypothetical protein
MGDRDKMSEECSICWEELQDPSVQLACKHKYHYGCITEWAKRNQACPMCRQAFTESVAPAEPSVWLVQDFANDDVNGAHLFSMVLSSVTALRFIALFCPNFVERLFEPQIKLGRNLTAIWKRYLKAAPTIVAMLLICSIT